MKFIKIIFLLYFILFNTLLLNAEFLKYKIVKVIDGDTIIVSKNNNLFKIRLAYIDTPEKKGNPKFYRDANKCNISLDKLNEMGNISTDVLKNYLFYHKYVYIKILGKDRYNRYLGIVRNDLLSYSLNYKMVVYGFACKYKYSNNIDYKEAMYIAKNSYQGLWKDYHKEMECLCGIK